MNAPAPKKLYDLLPVIHRMRDSERGWPLRALLDIVQEQVDNTRDNIAQLYDDWFIETCAKWAVPYIGDLLGVGALADVPDQTFSLRSFVGNTVALRRRKGTALVLERLAQELTLWPACVVEYFRLLAWTQHLAHLRAGAGGTADVSDSDAMRRFGGPFETTAHTVDVRHISTRGGRYNIPNVGAFLCRLVAIPVGDKPSDGSAASLAGLALAPATPDGQGHPGFRFSQLGHDMPLFNPAREKPIESRNLESDLPLPLPRRPLYDQLNALRANRTSPATDWDVVRAIQIRWTDQDNQLQTALPRDILIADLTQWGRPPEPASSADRIQVAVDPVLGRFTFPATTPPSNVTVGYWTGFSSRVGGGCYSRKTTETSLVMTGVTPVTVAGGDPASGAPALETALDTVKDEPSAILEIADNLVYQTVPVTVAAGHVLEIRAQDGRRPVLNANVQVPWAITLHKGALLRISGLLVSGRIDVSYVDDNGSGPDTNVSDTQLALSHCTLVPGIALAPDGTPAYPGEPSLTAAEKTSPLQIFIDRSICGPVFHPSKFGRVEIKDSALDGMGQQTALTSGITVVERSTILGDMVAYLVQLGSDSIFDGMPWTMRTQDGCMRYSYMPYEANTDAKAPRRYRCQPVMAVAEAMETAAREKAKPEAARLSTLARVKPHFTSRRYGQPGYLQLAANCPAEIAAGASNEAEMGVFNHLGQPQRLKNLTHVLDDYLRVGLEAGVFLVT